MVQLNLSRFFSLPNLLKPLQLLFGVIAMICVGAAKDQPSGTGLIWFTLIIALLITLIAVIIFALDLEQAIIPRGFLTWPLVECAYAVVLAIFNFISVWLCVGAAVDRYNNKSAFTAAGFFVFVQFLLYGFDFFLFLRIWMTENSGPPPPLQPGHPGAMAGGPPSYGSP